MAQAFKDVKIILNKSKEPLKKAEAVKEATDEKAEERAQIEEVEEVETLEDAEGAAKKITIEQIREVFVSKNTKGNTQKLKALLNEFGVKKVTDLKEEDYPEVLRRLEEI